MIPQAEARWTSGLVPNINPETVSEIITQVADVAILITPQGIVSGVTTNPGFRPKERFSSFIGTDLRHTLMIESVTKFNARLAEIEKSKVATRLIEVSHVANGDYPKFPVRYSFHSVADGTAILMLGRDMRTIAEMQQQLVNAQISLEKNYETRREHDLRFRVLMAWLEDAVIFVSLSDRLVQDCNPAALSMFGKSGNQLIGSTFDQLFEDGTKEQVTERLVNVARDEAHSQVSLKPRGSNLTVSVSPMVFRVGGEQLLLCRISSTVVGTLKSDSLQDNLSGLYDRGMDAIVFVSSAGDILSANGAFQTLTDVAHASALKGRSVADFLGRGGVDMKVMLENAARTGTMRIYTTKVVGEYGSERAVEISITHLTTGADPVFALVLRDTSRLDGARTETQQLGEVDMQSVIELIGSQSLRDIVAKTTDVVEKMCIETAVELTSNNRVAAAEMLGLSRQSLYVKLRKYGLLRASSDGD
jgi:transcriptional regulator PpsR